MMEWENGILSTAFELELVTRTSIKYLTTTWTASAFLVLAHELAGRNPTERNTANIYEKEHL